MDLSGLKYLIVGAGFFGSVIAERIANDKGEKVLVIDKRDHIGGNAYSEIDEETGIEYHKYGTHIFHTSNEKVWNYLRKFTDFNGYKHQVLSMYKNKVYQMPINLETINSFYGINLKPYEVDTFLKTEFDKEKIEMPKNLEEKAISLIGRPLYEAFIKGYTIKHWDKDPKDLPASIISRLPFRKNYNESYYFDKWEGIPLNGYTAIFKNLLSNKKNIEVKLNTNFFQIKDQLPKSCTIVYSGSIDSYFNFKFGKLEYRTIDLEKEIIKVEDYQGTSVMNYPEQSVKYTRIHEPRHLHPERNYTKEKTIIFKEYTKFDTEDKPFYPIQTENNKQLLNKYLEERNKCKNVIFGGRLGDYQYYDMHQVIGSALNVYEQRIKK